MISHLEGCIPAIYLIYSSSAWPIVITTSYGDWVNNSVVGMAAVALSEIIIQL